MKRFFVGGPMRTVLLSITLLWANTSFAADEQNAIRQVIGSTFDRPDAKVLSQPIVIAGQHAIVDWTQGEQGGRALMRQDHKGQWQVSLCTGDALRSEQTLKEANVPAAEAKSLLQQLIQAEKHVDAQRLKQMSQFKMNQAAHH